MVQSKKRGKRKPLLNPKFYREITTSEIYSDEKRLGKVFGAENKGNKEKFIRAISESKRPYGWRKNFGFDIFNSVHLDKLFIAIKKTAKRFGWKSKTTEADFDELKKSIREQQELILNLKNANEEAKINYEELLKKYREKGEREAITRLNEFKKSIEELKNKIKDVEEKKIPESELQDFLYTNTWMLGTEYISSKPQKMRGCKNRFDFYLERFNKTNDIVEIKLISDRIINKDGSISATVIQAVDQLIDYMESAIGAAHSTVISEEEGIKELRPRGIVIIGNDNSQESLKKLKKWNYQLSHICIYSYHDILDKAELLVKHVEGSVGNGKENKVQAN